MHIVLAIIHRFQLSRGQQHAGYTQVKLLIIVHKQKAYLMPVYACKKIFHNLTQPKLLHVMSAHFFRMYLARDAGIWSPTLGCGKLKKCPAPPATYHCSTSPAVIACIGVDESVL